MHGSRTTLHCDFHCKAAAEDLSDVIDVEGTEIDTRIPVTVSIGLDGGKHHQHRVNNTVAIWSSSSHLSYSFLPAGDYWLPRQWENYSAQSYSY